MGALWRDLLDPSRDELVPALPAAVDDTDVETLLSPPVEGREPWPFLDDRDGYVFGVVFAAAPLPEENRVVFQEVDLVATPEAVTSVRKTPEAAEPFGYDRTERALAATEDAGTIVFRIVEDVAETYLSFLDATYAEIDELEDHVDRWQPSQVRRRIAHLRHDLLRARRNVAALRVATRRVADGFVDVGDDLLFPRPIEQRFSELYETLFRVTEELDVARDLLASVQEFHQSKIAESQNEVVKVLTVVASLVLVPTLITGWYGQNFAEAFDNPFWSVGVSAGLIAASTIVQLVLFRWRNWI